MWQTILDAFERYRLYVLGGAGMVVVAIVTAVVVSVMGGNGGGQGMPPTDTPRATPRVTRTVVPEVSPTPATATPVSQTTNEPEPPPTVNSKPSPAPLRPTPTVIPSVTPTPAATNTFLPGQTPTPEPLSITIVSPEQGESVGATIMVEIVLTGVELALGPGGQLIPGAGHWHIALDTAPPLPEQHDELTVQFGPVDVGLHTITVLLYLNEADLTVVAIDQVQFSVTDEDSSPPTPSN